MKKNYRWGILGAGNIASQFCAALAYTKGSHLFAVASREFSKAKNFAEKNNIQKYYSSYDQLVNDADVDIVYIATPHAFHYQHALLCLKHGKHVLCEKPLTLSYTQSAALVDLAMEKNLFFMEAMWTSCIPSINKILDLIKNDVIGTVQYIQSDFGFQVPFDAESRMYNKSLGGGSLLDIGVYPIFLSTLILGEPVEIQSVSKLAETGVDYFTNIVLKYENGATAHLLSSFDFQTPVEAMIVGSKATIFIESPWYKATNFTVKFNDSTIEEFSAPHLCNGFEYEIAEVMLCLDNGLLQSVKMPHAQTLAVARVVDQILPQAGIQYPSALLSLQTNTLSVKQAPQAKIDNSNTDFWW